MNKAELIQAVAFYYDGSKTEAAKALNAVVETITYKTAAGEKVSITGLAFSRRCIVRHAWYEPDVRVSESAPRPLQCRASARARPQGLRLRGEGCRGRLRRRRRLEGAAARQDCGGCRTQ